MHFSLETPNSHCYRLLTYFLRRLMLMTTTLYACRVKLFKQGNFHCTLLVMAGYNQLEGSRALLPTCKSLKRHLMQPF